MPRTSTTMRPGETRNPKGRPKKDESLTYAMKAYLSDFDPVTKRIRREMLIEAIFRSALKGDSTSAKLIWHYMEGMPTQKLDTLDVQRISSVLIVVPSKRED